MSFTKLLWLRLLVPLLGKTIDLKTTLMLVLRKSLAHMIEKHAAQLCVLKEICNQLNCVKLVCANHNVSLISVLKIDSERKTKEVIDCSCVPPHPHLQPSHIA
ncbi:hypothetical protein PVL29_024628 [Vitis rotundifolia]|uniref:Secreted protein n=1 Tax=Vitis rotundifolia TaxID=103349 RepID=A0AA38YSC3_VITRO|nr:hypothetical protein PVL29_024628 [Vitis rotundifolia]